MEFYLFIPCEEKHFYAKEFGTLPGAVNSIQILVGVDQEGLWEKFLDAATAQPRDIFYKIPAFWQAQRA